MRADCVEEDCLESTRQTMFEVDPPTNYATRTRDRDTTSCINSFGDSILNFMGTAFYRLGNCIANRPLLTILVSLICVCVFASGIREMKLENRGDKLWVCLSDNSALLNFRIMY